MFCCNMGLSWKKYLYIGATSVTLLILLGWTVIWFGGNFVHWNLSTSSDHLLHGLVQGAFYLLVAVIVLYSVCSIRRLNELELLCYSIYEPTEEDEERQPLLDSSSTHFVDPRLGVSQNRARVLYGRYKFLLKELQYSTIETIGNNDYVVPPFTGARRNHLTHRQLYEQITIMFIGDGQSGMSSLIHRWCCPVSSRFTPVNVPPERGVEHSSKLIMLDEPLHTVLSVTILDVPDIESIKYYAPSAQMIFIIFDASRPGSFQSAMDKLKECKDAKALRMALMVPKWRRKNAGPVLTVLGNKCDLNVVETPIDCIDCQYISALESSHFHMITKDVVATFTNIMLKRYR